MTLVASSASLPGVPTDPISVRWTLHALDKAQKLGFARHDVESVLRSDIVSGGATRARRPGESPLGGS